MLFHIISRVYSYWLAGLDSSTKPIGSSLPHSISLLSDLSRKVSPSSEKWIPPKRREKLSEREVIFRKIRGVLNKLTPDNFEKLIADLVKCIVDYDKDTLKGAILLVFDKAVDEANYSFMYAKLCVRLNDLAPNFDDTSGATTFRRLLLAKCKEEFDNRADATAALTKDGGLTLDEEEQRNVAKRKMLGNIKFIGELFKLGMLHEKIIHQCIKELLEKKKGVSSSDMGDNMECLCLLLFTVGDKLDTDKAKSWVDQYFKRMRSLSKAEDLSPRIRFMLIDIIELRENKWVPRKSQRIIDPKPIQRSSLISYRSPHQTNSTKPLSNDGDKHSHQQNNRKEDSSVPNSKSKNDQSSVSSEMRKFPLAKKTDSSVSLRPIKKFHQFKGSFENVKSSPPVGNSDGDNHDIPINISSISSTPSHPDHPPAPPRVTAHSDSVVPPPPFMYPGPPPPIPGHHPLSSYPPRQMVLPPHGPLPPVYRGGPMIPSVGIPSVHYRHPNPAVYGHPPPSEQSALYFHGQPPPPPFDPRVPPHGGPWLHPHAAGASGSGYQMISPPGNQRSSKDMLVSPFTDQRKSPKSPNKKVTKSNKKGTSNKKHEPTKDEKVIMPIIESYLNSNDVSGCTDIITGLSTVLPINVITILISKTIGYSEDARCDISKLLQSLKEREYLTSTIFIKASGNVLRSLSLSDSSSTLQRNAIAGYLARAISQGLASLNDISSLFLNGAHYPVILIVLQALMNLVGQNGVQKQFQSEGIMMTSLLPESQRSYEAISQILEARNLGFLYPLKHIQSKLKLLLKQSDVSAVEVYKWLKTNVDNQLFKNPEFIMLLTKSILTHVTSKTLMNPTSEALNQEKRLMEEFKLIVQKLVNEDHSLQMIVIHSTQVFCHDLNFPKGLLLRLFVYWYEMDVIDEEVLLQWREDPSDRYPGKGKALFQVNQWLMLLAEADEEDDPGNDD